MMLWPLGIGIGFFLIFGFAAWLAVPSRVSNIRSEHIGSATGLMLTFAAIGGFFIPIIFGHLVPHTSYGVGWVFLAIVSFAFALVGMAGHNPSTAPGHANAGYFALEGGKTRAGEQREPKPG
jgi:nitrate/nitrite transporter NarK